MIRQIFSVFGSSLKSFNLQRRVSYDLTKSSPDGFPKLGRWSIQYDNNIIHRKIDQANEDHCGCCVNEFVSGEDIDVNEENPKEKEDYLIPYCM